MTIGVGIIGFGVMGRTHARAYQYAGSQGLSVELRGVCSRRAEIDQEGERGGNLDELAGNPDDLDFAGVRAYNDHEALLEDPEIHAVSITTYTETHVPIALAALAAGKHVLVEKPVALRLADVELLADGVPEGLVCMPAFCMRHWPGWAWLKARIEDQSFGALRSLFLRRFSEPPAWSPWFYGNPAMTGNALFDLHVHDADFALWCCGVPDRIAMAGTPSRMSSLYGYAEGPGQVVVEGGYVPVAGFGFQMRYQAIFDDAVVTFRHDRDPLVLLTRGGRTEPVELPSATAYELQGRHFIEQVLGTTGEPPRATMADAVAVTRLLEWEAGVLQDRT